MSPNSNKATKDWQSSNKKRKEEIRVGAKFQAKIPRLLTPFDRQTLTEDKENKALLVWSHPDNISNAGIAEYLEVSQKKYRYEAEQALGLLYWHRYDIGKALGDLQNFKPQNKWSEEDKLMFKRGCALYGKNFTRIHRMLPHMSMSSLIPHYYRSKKKTSTNGMEANQGPHY